MPQVGYHWSVVEHNAQYPAITSWGPLRPYASATVLEHTGIHMPTDVRRLAEWLAERGTRTRGPRSAQIIGRGVSVGDGAAAGPGLPEDFALDGFVIQVTSPPSWQAADSTLVEISFELTLIISHHRLLAVHVSDSSVRHALQGWLDREPHPPFRRIPVGTLNACLLTGETKAMWLKGTHPRRPTKADGKSLYGETLEAALGPLEDGTFALKSGVAELVEVSDDVLSGRVGTTLRHSLVWLRPTDDLHDFVAIMCAILGRLETDLDQGVTLERPYPWLAVESHSLTGVHGAYEIAAASVEESTGWPDDMIEAAELLERVQFYLHPDSDSPSFAAQVAYDGSIRGSLRCAVTEDKGEVRLVFGFGSAAGTDDPQILRAVLDALRFNDLLTVHYASGHAIMGRAVYSSEIRAQAFPGWQWADFTDYDIRREKPPPGQAGIHAAIASPGDRSLFAWVVQQFSMGAWLTCDDGAGEVADFVRYGVDDSLTLIHVKASHSSNASRQISAAPYEQVISQATKNLLYLDTDRLRKRLALPRPTPTANWVDGARVNDRSELLDLLASRSAKADLAVVIVQPQVTQGRYRAISNGSEAAAELMRVRLLDTMLHSARGSVTGLGAELYVVGDGTRQ